MMVFLDTGKQCTFAGMGPMYDKFLEMGEIEGFTGFGTTPAMSHQGHFNEAPLRIMTFSDTYGNVHDDFSKRTINSSLFFKLFHFEKCLFCALT